MTATPDCCEVWPALARVLHWFRLADEPRWLVMPSIDTADRMLRVNFCPSCGSERRSVVKRDLQLEAGK